MMTLFNHHSLLMGTVATVAVNLGACGSSPETKQSTPAPTLSEQPKESTASTSSTLEASPKPSPSPSRDAFPEVSKPDTSHNDTAVEYAYPSKKAQAWMKDPSSVLERIVFLTLDDGPDHTSSVQIPDTLRTGRVHGTFFVVGDLVGNIPETLKREIAEGYSVAMHSYTHSYNKLYLGRAGSLEITKGEYNKTEAALEEVLGADSEINTWRYLGGHTSWKKLEATDEALAAEDVHWIDWNCLTGDVEPKSRQPEGVTDVVKTTTSAIGEGLKVAVVLVHDAKGKDMMIKVMPQVTSAYKEAGYELGIIA